MEGIAVLVRTTPDGPPAFAIQLEESGVAVTYFAGVPDFIEKVTERLTRWLEIDAHATASMGA